MRGEEGVNKDFPKSYLKPERAPVEVQIRVRILMTEYFRSGTVDVIRVELPLHT